MINLLDMNGLKNVMKNGKNVDILEEKNQKLLKMNVYLVAQIDI